MKIAKILYVSMATRFITDNKLSTEEQLEQAMEQVKEKLIWKIENELYDNIEDLFDDTECPYDSEFDN